MLLLKLKKPQKTPGNIVFIFAASSYTLTFLDVNLHVVTTEVFAYTKSCDLRVIVQLVFVFLFFSFFDIYLS